MYYTHTCAHTGKKEAIREEVVFANLDKAIRDFRFSPAFAQNMKGLFQHVGKNQQHNANSEQHEINENIKFLEEKKSRFYDLFVDREIDRDMLRKKIDELDGQIARVENGRQSFAMDSGELLGRVCDVIDDMHEQPTAFLAAKDYDEKAEILRAVSTQVVMSKQAATIEWKTPYSHLLGASFQDLREESEGNGEEGGELKESGDREARSSVQAFEPEIQPRRVSNEENPGQEALNGRYGAFEGGSPVLLCSRNLTIVELFKKVEQVIMEMRIHFGAKASTA